MNKFESNKKWLEDNEFELVNQDDDTMIYVKETEVEMKKGCPKSCFRLKATLWKSQVFAKDKYGNVYAELDCGCFHYTSGWEDDDDVRKAVKKVMDDMVYSSRNALAAASEMSAGFKF